MCACGAGLPVCESGRVRLDTPQYDHVFFGTKNRFVAAKEFLLNFQNKICVLCFIQ